MSKKRGFLGVLVIGAVAAVCLLGLFVVSPSCAGAEPDPVVEEPPPPPPTVDPRAAALEDAAQTAVAATVTAATWFTPRDVELTVEAALLPDRRDRVFGPEGAAEVTPAPTPVPGNRIFGPAPVFGEDWVGAYGPLSLCDVPEGNLAIPCVDGWLPAGNEYSFSWVEPEGAAWLLAAWFDAGLDEDTVETRLAGVVEAAAGWPVYEFFGRSDAVSLSGAAGVRLDYGRQVVADQCVERVAEVWYEARGMVYLASYGYCLDYWEELGGYQDAVVLGVTFDGPR